MSLCEARIAEWYERMPAGCGHAKNAWDIEWEDAPFEERDAIPLSRTEAPLAMRRLLAGGTPTAQSAVYIHIPFCRLACTYCTFFKKEADEAAQHAYVDLLIREMETLARTKYVQRSRIRAVFMGGGTPGILAAGDIERLLAAVRAAFPLADDAEITMESSLSDMTEEKLDTAIAGGVNRFSFGVQSFDTRVRHAVGRPLGRSAAMERLSSYAKRPADMIIDLIYGLPHETEETMRQDILDAAHCGIAGLDLYKLQLLPNSPLWKSLAAAGKTLEEANCARLCRAASDAMDETGAEVISCTHRRMKISERSLYNTIASGGDDIIPVGMACGGRMGGISLMKPAADAMYRAVVGMGQFLPMGAKREGAYHPVFAALTAAGDRGVISPGALEEELRLPMRALLSPLLRTWSAWGLTEEGNGMWYMTAAGRYWYRTMTRVMLRAADHMLFAEPVKKASRWGGMINMK